MVQMDSLLPILMARLTGRPNVDAVFVASADIHFISFEITMVFLIHTYNTFSTLNL